MKKADDCGLNRNVIYRTCSNLSEDAITCYSDFYQLETDINYSLGISILKTDNITICSSLRHTDNYKKLHKLIPYISYIQERFARCTIKSKKGIFYNKDLDVYVQVEVNSAGIETSEEPSLETFKLVKWYIEINKEQRVPKDLLKYIEQEQALELLKG
nr:MAG TPA: hypothetical protein [Caudoviricetes sp.]